MLVDFSQFISNKDDILKFLWETYRVDSISGQWDYVEPVLFGTAAGKVIVDPLPLATYLQRQRSIQGIRVVRLNE